MSGKSGRLGVFNVYKISNMLKHIPMLTIKGTISLDGPVAVRMAITTDNMVYANTLNISSEAKNNEPAMGMEQKLAHTKTNSSVNSKI